MLFIRCTLNVPNPLNPIIESRLSLILNKLWVTKSYHAHFKSFCLILGLPKNCHQEKVHRMVVVCVFQRCEENERLSELQNYLVKGFMFSFLSPLTNYKRAFMFYLLFFLLFVRVCFFCHLYYKMIVWWNNARL
jgi:hypothetical protein